MVAGRVAHDPGEGRSSGVREIRPIFVMPGMTIQDRGSPRGIDRAGGGF